MYTYAILLSIAFLHINNQNIVYVKKLATEVGSSRVCSECSGSNFYSSMYMENANLQLFIFQLISRC